MYARVSRQQCADARACKRGTDNIGCRQLYNGRSDFNVVIYYDLFYVIFGNFEKLLQISVDIRK